MYYLTKAGGAIKSGFSVIPYYSSNLCNPVHKHDSSFAFLNLENVEREKITKFKYLEKKKNFLNEIKT